MLLDSSVWIEMFKGSEKGKRAQALIATSPCFASVLSLAEVAKWCIENGADPERYAKTIETNATLFNLKREILVRAGKFTVERKKEVHNWGMIDSLIYLTAQSKGISVLTADHHFEGLEGVQLL